jgi:Zn-dependent peptidase ImmA (M78 family)
MRARKSLARSTARDLLKEMGLTEPPVDPVEIARNLGVRVVNVAPPDEDVSGFLIREDPDTGEPIIGVNKHHSALRRRFTVAHELGHFLLDHEGNWHVDDMMISFRDSKSSTGEHDQEVEANQFAAALLMPRTWLKSDFPEERFDLGDDRKLKQLAARYRVSTQAMTFRLVNLDLLS